MTHIIKGITSDHDLIELARIIGVRLDDIFESSEVNAIPKKGSYLILLRNNSDVGHWVACHNGSYFDSMGEGGPSKFGVDKYNTKQYQSTYGQYCGIWCMLWLYAKQHRKMDLFKDMIDLNLSILY